MPALKLFDGPTQPVDNDEEPPAAAGDPRRRWTLRQCFEAYVVPELQVEGRAVQTLLQYHSMLSAWERLTDNPAVGDLDDAAVERWRQARHAAGAAHATCDKDARMLRRIFNLIGPWSPSNRQAREILARPPIVRMFGAKGVRVKIKRPVTDDVWGKLAAALPSWSMTHSPRVPGPLAGRLALVAVHATGLRSKDLFGLTWGNVIDGAECPNGWGLSHPHGWIWIDRANPAGGLQFCKKTGKSHLIPMTRSLRETIDAVRSMLGRPADSTWLIPLGGPDPDDDEKTQDARERRRHGKDRLTFLRQLNRDAGINGEPFLWHALRAGANEAWHRARPGSGDFLLQHAMTSVNAQFYRTGIMDLVDAANAIGDGPFAPLN